MKKTALMSFAEWMKDISKDTLIDIQSTKTAIIFRISNEQEETVIHTQKHVLGVKCRECVRDEIAFQLKK